MLSLQLSRNTCVFVLIICEFQVKIKSRRFGHKWCKVSKSNIKYGPFNSCLDARKVPFDNYSFMYFFVLDSTNIFSTDDKSDYFILHCMLTLLCHLKDKKKKLLNLVYLFFYDPERTMDKGRICPHLRIKQYYCMLYRY